MEYFNLAAALNPLKLLLYTILYGCAVSVVLAWVAREVAIWRQVVESYQAADTVFRTWLRNGLTCVPFIASGIMFWLIA